MRGHTPPPGGKFGSHVGKFEKITGSMLYIFFTIFMNLSQNFFILVFAHIDKIAVATIPTPKKVMKIPNIFPIVVIG